MAVLALTFAETDAMTSWSAASTASRYAHFVTDSTTNGICGGSNGCDRG